ncbi:uncharacterized protein LOC119187818 [Rhipicephalus microplus]|uniref:uncharacterized protein LOC119187818 n=1 Tax=Rhipicephalus microplus TaxID=6941 RepID=UPI003F6CED5B
MLSTAAIYVTVLCLIPGAFSQNELLYQSENYCRRFVSPTITSALGLCTYPCLLWSNNQPPKVLVISEPDGTACKIYDGFRQAPQVVGNCRAGFCHRTEDYHLLKRMKRDVSTSASSRQPNASPSQKQVQSRHGSEKPKISRTERIEHRRRQMWKRCDCASMRGLFIDMSYVVSGLRLGRRGKRERRRKVGCRVICLFLINKYKHDPKWAALFEARLSTPASVKLENATGALPGGNRDGVNTSTNRIGSTTNGISAAGPDPAASIVGVNSPGPIGSTETRLTNNLTSRPPATTVLTVVPGNKANSRVSESSNTGAGTGSVVAGSARASINGGASSIPPTTSSSAKRETSNNIDDNPLNNSAGAGNPGNGSTSLSTSTTPLESILLPSISGTTGISGKLVTTATTTAVEAAGVPSGGYPRNGSSGSGVVINAQPSTNGNGGISTGGLDVPGSPKNRSGRELSGVSAAGASSGTTTGAAVGAEGGTHPKNEIVSSTGLSAGPSHNMTNVPTTPTSGSGAGIRSLNSDGKSLQNTETSGRSTLTPNSSRASSNRQGTHGLGNGSVGSSLNLEASTGFPGNNGGDNHNRLLINGTNVTLKPQVESAAGPSTESFGKPGSGGNISVSSETLGSGALESSAGGLLRKPSAGSPTSKVTGGRENSSVSSTATSSSVRGVRTSSPGSSTNIHATNGHAVDVTSSSRTTSTGGNPSITEASTSRSSSSSVSGVDTSVSRGSGSSSGEGAINGLSSSVSVVSEGALNSGTTSANPRGAIIGPSQSSSGAGVETTTKPTRISVTEGGLPGASTAATNTNSVALAGGEETSAGISGIAPTDSGGAEGTSNRGGHASIGTEQPNESDRKPESFPEAASAGSRVGMGSGYDTGFGNSASYGAGAISGNGVSFPFVRPYGERPSGFGSTGNIIGSGAWGQLDGTFNGISGGYGNIRTFGNIPGSQPFSGAGVYGGNGRFPGDVRMYEDDIFFQD